MTSEINRKPKIVSFRVSEAEYEAIERASRSQGFASTALFARSTLLELQLEQNREHLERLHLNSGHPDMELMMRNVEVLDQVLTLLTNLESLLAKVDTRMNSE